MNGVVCTDATSWRKPSFHPPTLKSSHSVLSLYVQLQLHNSLHREWLGAAFPARKNNAKGQQLLFAVFCDLVLCAQKVLNGCTGR